MVRDLALVLALGLVCWAVIGLAVWLMWVSS